MKDRPRICVVIVTYNSDATIKRCIAALAAQTYREIEFVLVENGGTSGAKDAVSVLDVPVRFLERANLGFAAGNNLGVAQASPECTWIATLNPDAFPESDWLASFVEATARHPAKAAAYYL